MKNQTEQMPAPGPPLDSAGERDMRAQLALLGHDGLGVTELRLFNPRPHVAYTDNKDDAIRLCREMEGRTPGVYVGVQPRPAHLFDLAPNRWVPARGGPDGNCARDRDIEYITALFCDIDAVSSERAQGYPASSEELTRSLQSAELLSRQDGLILSSVVCCSGNGHYVLAPIAPISVGSDEVAGQFRWFCQELAASVAGQVAGVRIDPVYNLSRVMRVLGTLNAKGQPSPGRPHRRAHFITEPARPRSIDLHYLIVNTEVGQTATAGPELPVGLRCDLKKIEICEFTRYCRRRPQEVCEPLWFALLTNLVRLEGGIQLAHEISALDMFRYDRGDTQRVIERILHRRYRPVACRTIMSRAMVRPGRGVFHCSRAARCQAQAPMYLATSHTIYAR
jgi:hypothetical protein